MTTITKGVKIQEAALLKATLRGKSFCNLFTEDAPKNVQSAKKGVEQTSPHAPIVRVSDLSKTAGDEVDMQVVHSLSKRPTMGDRRIAGRGEGLEFADFALKINQGRHQVDSGGKMSQQRTNHQLRKLARTLMPDYVNQLQDQVATVHLAGARGDYYSDDIIVPLASDDEFADIMVNDVTPPTYDRHFFGGDATTFEGLDAADIFSIETLDNLNLYIEEMAHPLQPVRFAKDELAGDEPFYVLNVTPRQWADFYSSASGKDWQALTAQAMTRSRNFNHPVFRGDCAMRGNILVRKYKGMPIRFNTGSTVDVSANNNDATVAQVTAGTTIDRAMLLGGQALAYAWGKTQGGQEFRYHEEKVDSGNRDEVTVYWMNGSKKIRFKDKAGRINDHGVMALDTAVSQ
ncbi:phage capsid family protein [Vibrio parahaemolyticus]